MAKHIQGSSDWLEMRRNYIGASDAPAILGVSKWKTPLQLWEEKLNLCEDEKENYGMKRGTEMESVARCSFERETGLEMFPQVVFHTEHKFMMASLDGLTLLGDAAVEIKCPGDKDHATAMSGNVPKHYYPQLQHQLACLGLDMIYYYSFDGENGKIIEVKRDDEYISCLIEEEKKFWGYVETKTSPPFSDKDYETMEYSEKWKDYSYEIEKIDKDIKTLKEMRETIKNNLVEDSKGRNARGFGITLVNSFRKGIIDYSMIPELDGVDLEKYRKPGKKTWMLRFTNGNEANDTV